MEAVKLSRTQLKELHQSMKKEPLHNYEMLWVLESCLETGAGAVFGLGSFPWDMGLLAVHRRCAWLSLTDETRLEPLLAQLPELEVYRFYTADPGVLDMLARWLPGGARHQSGLWVRPLTRSWKKRFSVSLRFSPDPHTRGGWDYQVFDPEGLVATCSSQSAVPPWQEVMKWAPLRSGQYWAEQALGAVTANLLARDCPVVVRAEGDEEPALLESLGYREFCQLYYYIAPGE